MAGTKSKNKKPPPKTILSFFRPSPAPTPPRARNSAPRATSTPVDKGKRKAELVELSSDSEVEIVEPKPVKLARKEVKRVREVQRETEETRAGPSKVPSMKEEEKTGSDSDEGFTVEQLIEAALPPEERSEIADLPPRDEEGAAEEDCDEAGIEGENEPMQVEEGSQWGDDEVEGGEWDPDGGGEPEDWGEESMRLDEGDPFTFEDEAAVDSEAEEAAVVVQGSSKDLVAPPPSGHVCPICSKDLSMLISENQRQLHVNKCLDTTTSSTPASTSFLPRLSSLFRSAPSASAPKAKPSPKPCPLTPIPANPTPLSPPPVSSGPNAFTALMASTAEALLWKAAEVVDNHKGRYGKGETREVPFYKWIEGLEVTVDAFKYGKIDGCKGYFLSHAHSDHYQQLNSSWKHGPIYCSLTTANLIKLKLKVDDEWIHVLPMNETVTVEGIQVTLIDANHCPGSVLFLFEGPHTDPKSPWSKAPTKIFRYLHCGDFRASPLHITHPALVGKKIEKCYLDTTYLDPKYCFPAQELVVDACAELVRSRVDGDEGALGRVGGAEQERGVQLMKGWLVKSEEKEEEVVKVKKEERLLVVIGTYSIGKERIVKGIAKALSTKIFCDDRKLALLLAQDDPALHALITRDPLEAQVHFAYLQDINQEKLSAYLEQYPMSEGGFTKCVGLRPTGWTYKGEGGLEKMPKVAKVLERERIRKPYSPAGMYPQRDSTPTCLAYGVPYSEHSSFYELTCFALSLDYRKMIPTVSVHSSTSRAKMQEWFGRWDAEKKRRRDAKLPLLVPPRSTNYW